ncbi:MAG: hypothetical protein MUE68_01210 [Bacteroidetes bacterium]|nr:hypothetical protein [Bacteroidota bacterium]
MSQTALAASVLPLVSGSIQFTGTGVPRTPLVGIGSFIFLLQATATILCAS